MIEKAKPWPRWRRVNGLALGLVLMLTTAAGALAASGARQATGNPEAARTNPPSPGANPPAAPKYQSFRTDRLITAPILDPRKYCLSRDKATSGSTRRVVERSNYIDILQFRIRFHSGDEASLRQLSWTELSKHASGNVLADRPIRGELVALVQFSKISGDTEIVPLLFYQTPQNEYRYVRACESGPSPDFGTPNFYPTVVFTLKPGGLYSDLLTRLQAGLPPGNVWESKMLPWPVEAATTTLNLGSLIEISAVDRTAWVPVLSKLPGAGTVRLDDNAMPGFQLVWPVQETGSSQANSDRHLPAAIPAPASTGGERVLAIRFVSAATAVKADEMSLEGCGPFRKSEFGEGLYLAACSGDVAEGQVLHLGANKQFLVQKLNAGMDWQISPGELRVNVDDEHRQRQISLVDIRANRASIPAYHDNQELPKLCNRSVRIDANDKIRTEPSNCQVLTVPVISDPGLLAEATVSGCRDRKSGEPVTDGSKLPEKCLTLGNEPLTVTWPGFEPVTLRPGQSLRLAALLRAKWPYFTDNGPSLFRPEKVQYCPSDTAHCSAFMPLSSTTLPTLAEAEYSSPNSPLPTKLKLTFVPASPNEGAGLVQFTDPVAIDANAKERPQQKPVQVVVEGMERAPSETLLYFYSDSTCDSEPIGRSPANPVQIVLPPPLYVRAVGQNYGLHPKVPLTDCIAGARNAAAEPIRFTLTMPTADKRSFVLIAPTRKLGAYGKVIQKAFVAWMNDAKKRSSVTDPVTVFEINKDGSIDPLYWGEYVHSTRQFDPAVHKIGDDFPFYQDDGSTLLTGLTALKESVQYDKMARVLLISDMPADLNRLFDFLIPFKARKVQVTLLTADDCQSFNAAFVNQGEYAPQCRPVPSKGTLTQVQDTISQALSDLSRRDSAASQGMRPEGGR